MTFEDEALAIEAISNAATALVAPTGIVVVEDLSYFNHVAIERKPRVNYLALSRVDAGAALLGLDSSVGRHSAILMLLILVQIGLAANSVEKIADACKPALQGTPGGLQLESTPGLSVISKSGSHFAGTLRATYHIDRTP